MICSQLQQILIDRIKNSPQQRITFAEYMQLALYEQHYGYYNSGAVSIGAQGDFFTSSSLGQDFGELLAIQLQQMWHNLGCPATFQVVEMGAGNGELAGDILNYVQEHQHDGFECALEYVIIEESPALAKLQQTLLAESNFEALSWQNWSDFAEDSIVGCLLSNELIDAFPVHLVTKDQEELREVYLTQTEELRESIQPLSSDRLKSYLDLVGIDLLQAEYPQGYRTEINLNAIDWLNTVAAKLQRGYVCTIDYGYSAEKYYRPSRSQGTLQCHYQHRRHNNAYANLGHQDITAHVDFTALQKQGERCNLETIGFTQQGLFLMSLGLGDRLNELSSGKYNAVEIFKRRDALHQLIDPTGLGGFGVLIQGKNLTSAEKSLQGFVTPSMSS